MYKKIIKTDKIVSKFILTKNDLKFKNNKTVHITILIKFVVTSIHSQEYVRQHSHFTKYIAKLQYS